MLWALLFLPIAVWIVQHYVIQKEERYLESLFGEGYRATDAGCGGGYNITKLPDFGNGYT